MNSSQLAVLVGILSASGSSVESTQATHCEIVTAILKTNYVPGSRRLLGTWADGAGPDAGIPVVVQDERGRDLMVTTSCRIDNFNNVFRKVAESLANPHPAFILISLSVPSGPRKPHYRISLQPNLVRTGLSGLFAGELEGHVERSGGVWVGIRYEMFPPTVCTLQQPAIPKPESELQRRALDAILGRDGG